jgi:hypothetical protein
MGKGLSGREGAGYPMKDSDKLFGILIAGVTLNA